MRTVASIHLPDAQRAGVNVMPCGAQPSPQTPVPGISFLKGIPPLESGA